MNEQNVVYLFIYFLYYGGGRPWCLICRKVRNKLVLFSVCALRGWYVVTDSRYMRGGGGEGNTSHKPSPNWPCYLHFKQASQGLDWHQLRSAKVTCN